MTRGRSHVRKNQRRWDLESDEYQRTHGRTLARTAKAWGVWRIPERDLKVLGNVRGKDVLELGCGAARWSIALARDGARPVGIDISGSQLDHARRAVRRAAVRLPLVQASAEELPFRDERFDVVFCDHGALGFTDQNRTVPEVARVLRPGGLLAFSIGTPLLWLCWDEKTQRIDDRLHADWFERMRSAADEDMAQFQLPYAEWVAVFRSSGLVVEDLIHLRPPVGARTTYGDFAPYAWARRWPAEDLWKIRKPSDAVPDLVGVAEAAAILGWDKRRVATYIKRGSFPAPVAELAGGRVWRRDQIESFRNAFRLRQRSRRRP